MRACLCVCVHVCVYLYLLAACLQSCLQLPDERVFLPQSGSLLLLTLLLQPLQVPVGLCSLLQLQLFTTDQGVQTLKVTNTQRCSNLQPQTFPLFILVLFAVTETKAAPTDVGMLIYFVD